MVNNSNKIGGLFVDDKREKCGGAKKKCPKGHKVCRCKSKKSKKKSYKKKSYKNKSYKKKSSKKSKKGGAKKICPKGHKVCKCKPKKSVKRPKSKGVTNVVNVSDCPKLKDTGLKALCMKCFHSSGKTIKSREMDINGRVCKVNSRGRHMIQGKCVECSGNMTVFV